MIKNIVYFFLIVSLYACVNQDTSQGKLQIVCTTGIIEDAMVNMFGDYAEVKAIMGPGVDPHIYKPSQSDVSLLSKADIIVHNGLHLEGKMSEVLHKLSRTKKVYAISEGIDKNRLRLLDEKSGVYDPHIWFDVSMWQQGLRVLSQKMMEAHPTLQIAETRVNQYLYNLDSLHRTVQLKMREVDTSQKILITSHDAFNYFGMAYGVQVRGLQGISTVAEYGLRDVTDLVNYIISHKIKTVFVETSVSSRSIDAVIKGCAAKGFAVEIGGKLYSDALGDKGTSEGTYMGMVMYNVNLMLKAWSN